ncbi:MAG: Lon protease [Opitutia bacterium UBA7350]|nr:MAG: Lon protease [Opitutae bacterium UBA7350]
MQQEIEIPREVPVMTMSGAVLFPHAMMPLYIFEERYRQMLAEVLRTDRVFAVAALDASAEADPENETPCIIAGIGVIRACKTNEDGTANLILQGLTRVALEAITQEKPFRMAQIRPFTSEPGGSFDIVETIAPEIISLIKLQIKFGAAIPKELIQFLKSVDEPEGVLDLAIHTLCTSSALKQSLFETRGIVPRFTNFKAYLEETVTTLKASYLLRSEPDNDKTN